LLSTRILTSVILLAAFGSALILFERAQFALLVAGLIALGAFEWGRLAHFARRPAIAYATLMVLAFGAMQWLLGLIEDRHTALMAIFGGAGLLWLGVLPAWLRAGVSQEHRRLLPIAGFAILLPAGLAMIEMPRSILLLALGLVWVSDSTAYFAGRALGRHKLAPTISPGKTWEGVAGAALATAAYAIICAVLVPQLAERVRGTVWLVYLAGAEVLLLAGILGDLFESALKRQASVKDSGSLLPGHGGVLDRIDSAIAVLPIAALLLHWMTGT
jgi:phosphatidate cytidylyltransferase